MVSGRARRPASQGEEGSPPTSVARHESNVTGPAGVLVDQQTSTSQTTPEPARHRNKDQSMVAVCASPPMGPARTRWSARSGSPAPPSGSPGPDPHPATVCAVTCSIVFPEPSILRAAWLGWAEPSVHFGAQGEVMTSIDEFSGWGQLARVRYVENRRRVYIQLSNGSTGWVDSRRPVDFDVGDTVLLTEDNIELVS